MRNPVSGFETILDSNLSSQVYGQAILKLCLLYCLVSVRSSAQDFHTYHIREQRWLELVRTSTAHIDEVSDQNLDL